MALAALSSGESAGTYRIGSWVQPRGGPVVLEGNLLSQQGFERLIIQLVT